ncbi:hypothetical protein EJ110_NYTH40132 [Nymphaea thermarum]|nr:hypothetical protein EJ110_NYTH40132 [Nymphaea thermarum]
MSGVGSNSNSIEASVVLTKFDNRDVVYKIKSATNNYSEANKLGEGGFGSVYKLEPKLLGGGLGSAESGPEPGSGSGIPRRKRDSSEKACKKLRARNHGIQE